MKQTGSRQRRKGSAVLRVGARAAIGLVVLLFSLGVFNVLRENRPRPAQITDPEVSRIVRVIEATTLELPRKFRGFGTTQPIRSSQIAAEISARVAHRPTSIRQGTWVTTGTPIAYLEPGVYQNRLGAAQAVLGSILAELDALKVDLESTQERLSLSEQAIDLLDRELSELLAALDRGAAGQLEVDRLRRQRTGLELDRETLRQILAGIPARQSGLESRVSAQRAEIALAEIDLARTVITAPYGGVLAELHVDSGDQVAPGTAVARLVDLSTIEVPIRLPASAARTVRSGDRATVIEQTTSRKSYEGEVVRVSPEVDPLSRTITVFVEIEQETDPLDSRSARDLLLPGQFVMAEVRSSVPRTVLVLPRAAVSSDRVMVVDEESGTAQPRHAPTSYFIEEVFLDISQTEDQWAVIEVDLPSPGHWQPQPIRPGERVIITNLDELPAGTKVRIAPVEDRTEP